MKKLSVCIATYNGEKYIRQQLESIQAQLSEHDEIIVSDDSSTDRTIAIINSLSDTRIKLYENNTFRSPIYNFENCLSHATGDIIFLSDQDDIWLDDKVSIIQDIFLNNPKVTLVASDANLIDDNGKIIAETVYPEKIRFNLGIISNLIKNKYLGCTLAFRREMLDYLLPFPPDIPMHDVWIGIINKMYGKVYFADVPLISYRKHENNFSPSVRSILKKVVTWRWNLVKQVIKRMMKVSLCR